MSTSDVALLARLYRQGSGSKSEVLWSRAWFFDEIQVDLVLILWVNRQRANGSVSGYPTLVVRRC